MAIVNFDFYEEELEGDSGPAQGIVATCQRCGHSVEVFGTDDPSISRAAATLREECPKGENNRYE